MRVRLSNNQYLKNNKIMDQISSIVEKELSIWNSLSMKEKSEDNLKRLESYIVPFDKLAETPFKPATAEKYTVIFLHIPKTGGTTIEYLLAKNYKINGVIHINAPALNKNPFALFKKGDLPHVIMGHYKTSHLLYRFIDRPLVHFTMLRDPVKRVLSYFDYLQTSPNHGLYEKASKRSLEEFINGNDMVELSNAQTLRLAGRLSHTPLRPWEIQECFEVAKESLQKRFSLVGLTERYPEFMLMAQRTLGWSDIFHEYRNISKKKTQIEDIPSSILERIRERNAYDIELYKFATEIFQKRCLQLSIDETTVEKFKQKNYSYQQLINSDRV